MISQIVMLVKRCLIIQALIIGTLASVLFADEVYHVGAGQEYSSIMQALLNIPKDLAGRGEVSIVVHRKDGQGPWVYNEKVQVETEYDFDNEEEGPLPGFQNASSSNYLKITVAEGDRHCGKIGKGVVIVAPEHCEGDNNGFRITVNHTVIDGFAVTGCDGEAEGIFCNANNVCVKNVIVHDTEDESPGFYFSNYAYEGTVRNCIIYNTADHGIVGLMKKLTIENTTIFGCRKEGIYGRNILAKNVISVDNYGSDFHGWYKSGSCNNISSDLSAPGSNKITDVDPDDLFKSLSADNPDLHLIEGAPAIDQGTALTEPVDIDGEVRPMGEGWDIGADEYRSDEAPWNVTVDILDDEDDGNLSIGEISLREAIKNVRDGGYVNFEDGLSGVITLNFGSYFIDKSITIAGTGNETIILNGNNSSSIFYVDDNDNTSANNVHITGLSMVNGNQYDNPGDGGAIFNTEDLQITNCIIENSIAYYFGGAISSRGPVAKLNLYQTAIRYCDAQIGGAIYNEGDVTMHSCTFKENNASNNGGALYNARGTIDISDCIFDLNYGYWTGAIQNEGVMNIKYSALTFNAGRYGGAIRNFPSGVLNIVNTTISSNYAQNFGAAIDNYQGTVELGYVTITQNSCDGSVAGVGNSDGTVIVANSIIAGNMNNKDVRNDFTSEGHNIIGNADDADGFTNGVNNDRVGNTSNPFDPMLKPLAFYGGLTMTHELVEGSPAINAADPENFPIEDQRHMQRPQRGTPDIGAFEINGYEEDNEDE